MSLFSETWQNELKGNKKRCRSCETLIFGRVLQFQQEIVHCSTFKNIAKLGPLASDDADTLNL